MNPLTGAAQELALATASLLDEVDKISDPPSQTRIEAVQRAIDKVQHRLNTIQTATDTWSDLREAGARKPAGHARRLGTPSAPPRLATRSPGSFLSCAGLQQMRADAPRSRPAVV